VDRLATEMQSRFLQFHLKPYTLAEFNMVAKNLVTKRFNKSEEIAEKIATTVWEKMDSKDIRDVIKVARLTKNEDDIDMLIGALKAYGKKEDDELT
jgi:Holliday junction DNA helicase RuvB